MLILAASLLVGCDGMNSINQKYYDRGETIYTGIVDSINVYPGYGKVAFDWQINADPRINKLIAYDEYCDDVILRKSEEKYTNE